MSYSRTSKLIVYPVILFFQIMPFAFLLCHAIYFSTWEDRPGWIADPITGCKYYTHHNHEHRSAHWDGECLEGMMHGYGNLIVYEDDRPNYRFRGTLKRGMVEGFGTLVSLDDGDVFEGNFSEGLIDGLGHLFNDDGDHYQGGFKKGVKEGYGTLWYEPDHAIFKYSGLWENGLKHGKGNTYFRDGHVQEELYSYGKRLTDKGQQDEIKKVPKNILITNDDGVEDMDRLICLAQEMSTFADRVVIVASRENKSGTSNRMLLTQQGFLETKCLSIDSVRNIEVYQVEGFPADCVLFGALGIFGQQGLTVDLIISGINGGPNKGVEWFGSGTVGAARTAAILGIPAMAISGINEERGNASDLKKLCEWVGGLAQSGVVEEMNQFEYLTVSIPEDHDAIKGIRLTSRAMTYDKAPFELKPVESGKVVIGNKNTWALSLTGNVDVYNTKYENDVVLYDQDYIVIVPMTIDENNPYRMEAYQQFYGRIPGW